MHNRLVGCVASLVLFITLMPASAQALVLQIDFEASGDSLATDPAIGTVVLELEPGVNVEDVPVISSSFNFGPISDVAFSIFSGDNIIIGGLGDTRGTSIGTDDFVLLVFDIFDAPNFATFTERTRTTSTTVSTVTGSVTAVPLPAPALLLIAGFGALAVAARRAA